MTCLPLRTFPGNTWPAVADGEMAWVWAAYLQLDRTQWQPADTIEARQLAQVRVLLEHSSRTVPYCQRILAEAGLRPDDVQTMKDFHRIPLLPERHGLERFADLRADSLPTGTVEAATDASGGPVEVPRTNVVNVWQAALELRHAEWRGIDLWGPALETLPEEHFHRPEAGLLASPCPDGHGWHAHAESVLLEVLDEGGRPCVPGQSGRVVLTTLQNFLTPLLRYEIGDQATVGPGRCPCGRGLPWLAAVNGQGPRATANPQAADSRAPDPTAPRPVAQRRAEPAPFFRVRSVSGSAWPALPLPEISQVWGAYLELGRTQWLDRAAIEAGQLAQARTLLAHCHEHVPYCRQLLTTAGMQPADVRTMDDFRRIPLLARRTYQERFAEFCATALPPGTRRTDTGHTSGTSGVPVEVHQTNVVNFWWLAFYLRDAEWSGIQQQATLAAIRATGKTDDHLRRMLEGAAFPYWHQTVHQVTPTGPCWGMDIHQEPRRQLDWLRRIQPTYLLSFPSNLEHLAGLLQETGEPLPGLRAVLSFAETLTAEAQARIEAGFGVPVKNSYSCVEAGYLASPCPEGHGLHVHAENVLLEVLDDQDRPCAPGETGRVVLTTLHNFMTPLIRYEILDEATVGPERCPCGRGLPLLTRVHGRRHPLLRLPDGRRKMCTALVVGLRDLEACHQYQIVHRAVDWVQVRVVPNRRWTAEHPGRIVRLVQDFFAAPIRVEVETFEALPLPPGGKLRVVVVEPSR